MNTIFSDFSKDVDLSIFKESKKDSKSSIRRHYLSLVGLLEYVDIINGDLPGRSLPDGMTADDVKRMVSHAIGDLDTMRDVSTDGTLHEHEYVDLGLPSGTLWATENIKDANGNELYFAWGETRGYTKEQVGKSEEGKIAFNWNDYAFGAVDWDGDTNYGMKKYNNTDELEVLEPKDDAATVNWGEGWKMPTSGQIEELRDSTRYEQATVNGIPGTKLISKVEGYTDKFLFFPVAGYVDDGEVNNVGRIGSYWSSSMYRFMGINTGGALWLWDGPMYGYYNRCCGCPVRPVRTQGVDRTQNTEGAQGTQGAENAQGTEGTQDVQGTQGSEGTQGA